MRRLLLVLFLSGSVACAHNPPPPTPVAAVADAATRIEQSANVILKAAQSATALVGVNGQPLVSRAQLDVVALAVNRIGHVGISLGKALGDYNAAKAAGSDVAAQRAVVLQIVTDVSDAMATVGKAIPSGTLKTIDDAVNTVASLMLVVKTGAGI